MLDFHTREQVSEQTRRYLAEQDRCRDVVTLQKQTPAMTIEDGARTFFDLEMSMRGTIPTFHNR